MYISCVSVEGKRKSCHILFNIVCLLKAKLKHRGTVGPGDCILSSEKICSDSHLVRAGKEATERKSVIRTLNLTIMYQVELLNSEY